MTLFPARAELVAQALELPNLGRLFRHTLVPEEMAAALVRVVGCGWTSEQVDALLADPYESGGTGEMQARLASLDAVKHLTQDEVLAWIDAHDGDLGYLLLDQDNIDQWRITVPGPLGALCFAAGLTPEEAAARAANGELDEEALRTMVALRRTRSEA